MALISLNISSLLLSLKYFKLEAAGRGDYRSRDYFKFDFYFSLSLLLSVSVK